MKWKIYRHTSSGHRYFTGIMFLGWAPRALDGDVAYEHLRDLIDTTGLGL